METMKCCLCSEVTENKEDLENHIFTKHNDIFRQTNVWETDQEFKNENSPNKINQTKSPNKIYKNVLESSKKIDEASLECESVSKIEEFSNQIELKINSDFKAQALVIVEGKRCFECNFIATNENLFNEHKLEKHSKKKRRERI